MYRLIPEQVNLPPLIPGTENRFALPRPDVPLVCVRATESKDIYNIGMDGLRCSRDTVIAGQYHVIPQVGHQHVVSSGDVAEERNWDSFFAFCLSEPARFDDPIWPVMKQQWGVGADIRTLYRRLPAYVVGQIVHNSELLVHDWLEAPNGARWRVLPGAWIIRELSGRGLRVVPGLYMGREFLGISRNTPGIEF